MGVHAEEETVGVRDDVRRGHRQGVARQLRVPNGVHDARLRGTKELQLDPDKRPVGFQGIRHSHAYG